MEKILITGATGFIGSWLTRFFLVKNHKLVLHGSTKETINNLKKKLSSENYLIDNMEFWQQNFLESKWNFPDFSEIKNIIHCAAATQVREGTIEYYDKYFGLNVIASKILAIKALEENISHFIHFSTGQIFGHPPSFPIIETTPKNPINLYGYTKLISEKVIESIGILGLTYTILRPFSVYGKDHYNIISIITDKVKNDDKITVYGDGTQTRAFLHIDSICKATELILNNKNCFNKEYNLSGQKEYSVNELINLISIKFGKTPKIFYQESKVNELKRNIADISKIMALGFKPEASLEDFIQNLE